MSIVRIVLAVTLFTLLCAVPAAAKAWRGVVPLRSTRANVEKLLGAPQPGTRNVYQTSAETVVLTYAEVPCAYGWQVPLDTVISLSVSPAIPLKLDDLKLEESKYEKRRDNDDSIYYYLNQNEGINWIVHAVQRTIKTVEYYPSEAQIRLRCSPIPTRQAQALPKTSAARINRPRKKASQATSQGSEFLRVDSISPYRTVPKLRSHATVVIH